MGRRTRRLLLISSGKAVFIGIDVCHFIKAFGQHFVRDFGVNLGGLDVRVSQHPAYDLDADSLCESVRRANVCRAIWNETALSIPTSAAIFFSTRLQ